MESTTKLYSLNYTSANTYLFALLFIVGNIALPQLCHLVHLGGPTMLPIYFFTLVGAYKYGFKVGLLTAILSPLINSALFGMPAVAVLPAMLAKSVVLAVAAGYMANRFRRIAIPALLGVVLAYQVVGILIEWAIVGNFYLAVQDFRIGVPGMLLQIFGGYALLKAIAKK
ncbi:MAG: ECF transporter S component [Bacteroides sp.]|nr:ECF transporter S component [Bacteroides sp.]